MKRFLALAGFVAFLAVPWANASVEVRIINAAGGGDSGWIVCGGTSCSTGLLVVGNYEIASNITIQHLGFNPLLDLSYTASTSVANAGTLVFESMADGYSIPITGTFIHGSGNSTLSDSITINSYGGNNNTTCAAGVNGCHPNTTSAALGSIGPFNDNAGYNVIGGNGGGNTATPYSLGLIATLANATTVGGASGDIQLNAVPEPASVALLGGVMLFAVSTIRRKMRRTA